MRRIITIVLIALIVLEGLRGLTYLSPQYTEFKIRERDLASAWNFFSKLSVRNLSRLRNTSFGYEVLIPTPEGGLRVGCRS